MDTKQSNILLIDSNVVNGRFLKKLLTANSPDPATSPYHVWTAVDLTKAFALLQEIAIDAILLAIPDNSLDLSQLNSLAEQAANTPIIILGEFEQPALALEAISHGAQEYLPKSVWADYSRLTQTIRLSIARHQWHNRHDDEMIHRSLRNLSELKTANAQIQQKARELETQNMALDEFAYTVAHQIQGLLSQMVGYASFIEMHHGEDMRSDVTLSLNRIVQSGNKMNNVINELLLLASMRSTEIVMQSLDMGRIVKEVKKRLRFEIKEENAEISAPDVWPTALGHESWIEEAMLNYISNAIKYGGNPPQLLLGADELPGNMVRIWVKDNGAGIPNEDQKRLFTPHTRLRKVRARGEGLGLAIVRRIIHQCGGEVGVESGEGEGSIFWFTLPQSTQSASSHDLSQSATA